MAWAAALLLLVLSSAASFGGAFQKSVEADLKERAEVRAALNAGSLRSALARYAFAPTALAEDSDVRRMLTKGDNAKLLNRKFELLSRELGSATIYLLDTSGKAIVASNHGIAESFIGHDYSFRPYFTESMRSGTAEMFALGSTTRRPGLYLSKRVEEGLGVIVVKITFEALESQWTIGDDVVYVSDQSDTVLITNRPEARFQKVASLADPFPDRPLQATATAFVREQWRIHVITPADRSAAAGATAAGVAGGLGAGMLMLALGFGLGELRRAQRAAASREAARRELEERVQQRTSALKLANEKLLVEMEERRRAETRLDTLQHEMVNANKLAVLGQVSAGVAHEINQPLAALSAYAENAAAFLGRNDVSQANAALEAILGMASRIGAITDELRAFSRKSRTNPAPMALEDAISGALLLMAGRLHSRGVSLIRTPQRTSERVVCDRMRFEQVLVNLIQNAVDALEHVPQPEIHIVVEVEGPIVRVMVRDNGPGPSREVEGALFTPFVTSKSSGLGLGLVISRDIMRELGGDLILDDVASPGACFVARLRLAP